MLLDGFRNRQQKLYNDCLIACCQQILENFGIEKSDKWFWDLLVSNQGEYTIFSNLKNLEKALGLVVDMRKEGTVAVFEQYISVGLPIIAALNADRYDLWPYYRDHAVVVIGFDDHNVYVNDPAQQETGLAVDKETFLLAWVPRDYEYAVIRLG